MRKRWFVLGIVLIVMFVIVAFVYFATAKPNYKKEVFSLDRLNVTVIEPIHVKYLLNEMGAYQLHNPPLSSEKPVIQVNVDSQVFYAECNKGIIGVSGESKGQAVDLKIITSSEELINILASSDVKEAIKSSVQSGKIQLELVAGYSKLFSKRYLSLYQDITGKSFTGSVVRIFAS